MMKKVIFLFLLSIFLSCKLSFSESMKILFDPEISKEIENSYKVLTDPGNLIIGSHCGYAGQKPKGLAAIQVLARYKRLDLIQKILNGPNLGGQVYAAWALLEFQKRGSKISVTDRMKIKDLELSKKVVPACYGCFSSSAFVKDVLEFKKESPLAGISFFERPHIFQLDDTPK